jgi:signal transduction histidine kinase/CheY-like chemotaxis protein
MNGAARTLLEQRTREAERATAISAAATWGGLVMILALIGIAAAMSAREFREQRVESWIRQGHSKLSLAMAGELEVAKLGANVASFLARYLDAQVAAVYLAERTGELVRIGGYALPSGEPEEPRGLLKQAFDGDEVLVVEDVPDGYFVESGLGKSRPRHLVIAPAHVDGKPNAVVELGFFHPVAELDLALMRRAAESIGSAIRAARYRRDLERLLDETQRQAEELQTQQEELRVQNEELEDQRRVLQESQERLRNQQAELEQINTQLEEQTRSLEQQKETLVRAKSDVERATVYKSEFLANMSHELRTPLNSTLILAKLLVDNREGNLSDEQIKFARTIYTAGNELLTLISDILDLSKIEAGKLEVRPEAVSLGRLLDDLTNTFAPMAKERGLELAARVEPDAPTTIHTDPMRLHQVLKNLVANALKFTERGGVSVTAGRCDHGGVRLTVKDTGVGIAPENHALVFEAFRQADGNTTRRYGGTGLGLSISRDLTHLLGGTIELESAPGRGSTFTVFLPERIDRTESTPTVAPPPRSVRRMAPLAPAPAPGDGRASHANGRGRDELITSTLDDRAKIVAGSRVVLLIEDDPNFSRILVELAHELEFLALVADSAEEGLLLAGRYRPSAILLDVGLPDRSGLSVLDELKHSPSTRHIPVHIVSCSDFTQTALQMGAAGYAIKPVERDKLVTAFRRLEAKFTQKLRRILLVEDDDKARDATTALLAGEDVEIVAVGTAEAALEQLAASTFDCMVLDLTLPDRTGFELLGEMSQQDRHAFPPVIVYTGMALSAEEEQALRRFSSSIIIKGARSPERLLDEVTLFLHQVEANLPPDRQRMLRDARHREAVFEGRRVLVVEDDVRNIFALTSVLEPKGATVEIARNGREALEHLKNKPGVDLVLMDIMMPEMDGLQATREIRKQPALAKLPIIALTAKAMTDDREHCLAAGANDYIAKPLDVDKLLSLARVWMPK